MVTPAARAVVLVTFPFSDLNQSKLRPAVVLAAAGFNDWILCQIGGPSIQTPSQHSTNTLVRQKYFRVLDSPMPARGEVQLTH
ncbi:MAG: hypothetical protein L0Z50_23695 [Verrucomicrobiales bacterium]|nr:hypothetical protein [Verrucomicrobiales bacterium]